MLAYLAGEEWKLQAFRDYDAGTGPDLYCITACSIIGGDPWNLPKKDRNVFGKVPDLAGGYGGGNGAFDTFEKAYGVNLLEHWPTIERVADPLIVEQAKANYADWGRARSPETPELLWIAREVCKLAWRRRHPATVALWKATENAARLAILNPGVVYQAGPKVAAGCVSHVSGRWLLFKLPSGKYLNYYEPRVDVDGTIWYQGYASEDGKSTIKVWTELSTYGGKIVENECQALAGDVLKHSMPAIEAAGYELVLTVHDEDVTQAPDSPIYCSAVLSRLLADPPPWAPDLPLSAAGFGARRYKKED